MIHKGQIVEIPRNSPKYTDRAKKVFLNKHEELLYRSQEFNYSLFDGILLDGHYGIENFTIGQRKKITKGGHPLPLYVIAIDESENRVFVGAGSDHFGSYTEVLKLKSTNFEWIQNKEDCTFPLDGFITISSNSERHNCTLYHFDDDFFLEFHPKIKYLNHKQPLTFYSHEKETTKIILNNH